MSRARNDLRSVTPLAIALAVLLGWAALPDLPGGACVARAEEGLQEPILLPPVEGAVAAYGDQTAPRVCRCPLDSIAAVAVWQDFRYGGSDIFAARLGEDAEPIDTLAIPVAVTPYEEIDPNVACTLSEPGGMALIVWRVKEGDTWKVQAVRMRVSDGTLLDEEPILVAASRHRLGPPDVAFGEEYFLVVWWTDYGERQKLLAMRVDPEGFLVDGISNPIPVATENYLGRASVDFADVEYGSFLVVWQKSDPVGDLFEGDVLGRFVHVDGTPVDTLVRIYEDPYGSLKDFAAPDVAFGGDYFVIAAAARDSLGGECYVQAQIRDAVGALVVDSCLVSREDDSWWSVTDVAVAYSEEVSGYAWFGIGWLSPEEPGHAGDTDLVHFAQMRIKSESPQVRVCEDANEVFKSPSRVEGISAAFMKSGLDRSRGKFAVVFGGDPTCSRDVVPHKTDILAALYESGTFDDEVTKGPVLARGGAVQIARAVFQGAQGQLFSLWDEQYPVEGHLSEIPWRTRAYLLDQDSGFVSLGNRPDEEYNFFDGKRPVVSTLENGFFSMLWLSATDDRRGADYYLQVMDADSLEVLEGSPRVSLVETQGRSRPAGLASMPLADGSRLLYACMRYKSGATQSVLVPRAMVLESGRALLLEESMKDALLYEAPRYETIPGVGIAKGEDRILVVWSVQGEEEPGVYYAFFDSLGAISEPTLVVEADSATAPAAAFGHGLFWLAWQEGTAVSACRITPQGVVLDPGGLAVADDAVPGGRPSVAHDGVSSVILWQALVGEKWVIEGARFLDDGSLGADSPFVVADEGFAQLEPLIQRLPDGRCAIAYSMAEDERGGRVRGVVRFWEQTAPVVDLAIHQNPVVLTAVAVYAFVSEDVDTLMLYANGKMLQVGRSGDSYVGAYNAYGTDEVRVLARAVDEAGNVGEAECSFALVSSEEESPTLLAGGAVSVALAGGGGGVPVLAVEEEDLPEGWSRRIRFEVPSGILPSALRLSVAPPEADPAAWGALDRMEGGRWHRVGEALGAGRAEFQIGECGLYRVVFRPGRVPPRAAVGLRVWPNPVLNAASVCFRLGGCVPGALEIFDLEGRCVRRLALPMGRTEGLLRWGLDDNRGVRVPAGVYYLRLLAGGQSAVVRTVVLN